MASSKQEQHPRIQPRPLMMMVMIQGKVFTQDPFIYHVFLIFFISLTGPARAPCPIIHVECFTFKLLFFFSSHFLSFLSQPLPCPLPREIILTSSMCPALLLSL